MMGTWPLQVCCKGSRQRGGGCPFFGMASAAVGVLQVLRGRGDEPTWLCPKDEKLGGEVLGASCPGG